MKKTILLFITVLFLGINFYPKLLLYLHEVHTSLNKNTRANAPLLGTSFPLVATSIHERYRKHLSAVFKGCEDVCLISPVSNTWDQKGSHIFKPNINCDSLLKNTAIDRPSMESHSPQDIPEFMIDPFTYEGMMPYRKSSTHIDFANVKETDIDWTPDLVDALILASISRTIQPEHATNPTEGLSLMTVLEIHAEIQNSKVLVIGRGDSTPWIEAILIHLGASSVTTLSQKNINCTDSRIRTVALRDIDQLDDNYDVTVAYSSLENIGLGTTGDALNPWRDRQTVARAWCMSSPAARLVVAVPFDNTEPGIEFNKQRIHSWTTLLHLMTNWKIAFTHRTQAYMIAVGNRIHKITA